MANTMAYFTQRMYLSGSRAAIMRKIQAETKETPNAAARAATDAGPLTGRYLRH